MLLRSALADHSFAALLEPFAPSRRSVPRETCSKTGAVPPVRASPTPVTDQ